MAELCELLDCVPSDVFSEELLLTMQTLRSHQTRDLTLLDVGAHAGVFAQAANAVLSLDSLICFEPNIDLAAKLTDRASSIDARVIQAAVSDEDGQVDLHIHVDDSMTSIVPSDREAIAADFPWDRPDDVRIDTVRAVTLDSYVRDNCPEAARFLLKIDTQGNELAVLRGAQQVLERTDLCLIEFMFRSAYERQHEFLELVSFLDDAGFVCEGPTSISRRPNGMISGVDFVFVSRARA